MVKTFRKISKVAHWNCFKTQRLFISIVISDKEKQQITSRKLEPTNV